jgi:hypothetical protein
VVVSVIVACRIARILSEISKESPVRAKLSTDVVISLTSSDGHVVTHIVVTDIVITGIVVSAKNTT